MGRLRPIVTFSHGNPIFVAQPVAVRRFQVISEIFGVRNSPKGRILEAFETWLVLKSKRQERGAGVARHDPSKEEAAHARDATRRLLRLEKDKEGGRRNSAGIHTNIPSSDSTSEQTRMAATAAVSPGIETRQVHAMHGEISSMEKEVLGTREFASGDFDLVSLLCDLRPSGGGCRNPPDMEEIEGSSTTMGSRQAGQHADATLFAETQSPASDSTYDPQLPLHIRGQAECWEVPRSELAIGDTVSRNKGACIFKCRWRGLSCEAKVVQCNTMESEERLDMLLEVETISRLRHPGLVLFLGACTRQESVNDPLIIIWEAMEDGSLAQLFDEQRRWNGKHWHPSTEQALCWMRDIGLAATFLHGCQIPVVHGNINPHSILRQKGRVRLSDFAFRGRARQPPSVHSSPSVVDASLQPPSMGDLGASSLLGSQASSESGSFANKAEHDSQQSKTALDGSCHESSTSTTVPAASKDCIQNDSPFASFDSSSYPFHGAWETPSDIYAMGRVFFLLFTGYDVSDFNIPEQGAPHPLTSCESIASDTSMSSRRADVTSPSDVRSHTFDMGGTPSKRSESASMFTRTTSIPSDCSPSHQSSAPIQPRSTSSPSPNAYAFEARTVSSATTATAPYGEVPSFQFRRTQSADSTDRRSAARRLLFRGRGKRTLRASHFPSESLMDLVVGMLDQDPARRPSAQEVVRLIDETPQHILEGGSLRGHKSCACAMM